MISIEQKYTLLTKVHWSYYIELSYYAILSFYKSSCKQQFSQSIDILLRKHTHSLVLGLKFGVPL